MDRKTYYFRNYDYYWLKYTLERGAAEHADKLIVGHSLARFGICDIEIPGLINLSFLSQDYYYSLQIARKAFDMIPTLRHVILGCSYISPYMDLSRSKNSNELARITNVYGKYFDDWHHYAGQNNNPEESEQETDTISEESCRKIYSSIRNNYFCPERTRKMLADMDWTEFMPEEERYRLTKSRTAFHNKLLRHKETYEENSSILKQLTALCEDRNAKFTMIVFPSNRYYRHFLDPRFREGYYDQIETLLKDQAVRCIDLFDSGEFDSITDFIDTDHLNDQGAAKMTVILRQEC